MDWLLEPQAWIALATLTALELVLGVDNIVFISILAGKLPPAQRDRARRIGLGLAMFMRIALLLSIAWVIRLTAPLFTLQLHLALSRQATNVCVRPVSEEIELFDAYLETSP